MRFLSFPCLLGLLCAAASAGEQPAALSPDAAPDSPSGRRSITVARPASDSMRYKLIPLESMPFQTVDSVCRPWLSPGGVLTFEPARGSILVYDRDEVIAKIMKFILEASSPPVNVMVEVEYAGSSAKASNSIKVSETGPRRNPGYPNPNKIDLTRKGGGGSSYDSMSVLAGNGQPATLWACQTVVDPSWLQTQRMMPFTLVAVSGPQQITVSELGSAIRWADVGSKLMVQPLYDELSGNVAVELFPVLSFIDGKGRERAVKVESLSTRVVVKEGQRVSIGGLISAKSEDYMRILSGRQTFAAGTSSQVSATDITVTCRAMKPDGSRKGSSRVKKDYEDPMDNFRR